MLDRRRVDLVSADLPHQPHHHEAARLDLADAQELVGRVVRSSAEHARAGLSELQTHLGPQHRLVSIALREGPALRIPETLAEVLESQAAMIAADGVLYRDAICGAAAALGVDVALYLPGAETARAARALGVEAERMAEFLGAVGRELGPPWRKEHRSAAAAAIGVLGEYARLDRLPPS